MNQKAFIIINLLALILALTTSFTINKISEEWKKMERKRDPIRWSKDRQLRIQDFTIISAPIQDTLAISNTGIVMSSLHYQGLHQHEVYAVFYPDQSYWCKNNGKHILKHEQGHFDITHYLANELKKELKTCQTNEKCQAVFDRYTVKRDSMQNKYDFETNHSRDSIAQNRWNNYIDSLLR